MRYAGTSRNEFQISNMLGVARYGLVLFCCLLKRGIFSGWGLVASFLGSVCSLCGSVVTGFWVGSLLLSGVAACRFDEATSLKLPFLSSTVKLSRTLGNIERLDPRRHSLLDLLRARKCSCFVAPLALSLWWNVGENFEKQL